MSYLANRELNIDGRIGVRNRRSALQVDLKKNIVTVNCDHARSIQCPTINWTTLGQYKSESNNRMIQLTEAYCVLFRYIMGPVVYDYITISSCD